MIKIEALSARLKEFESCSCINALFSIFALTAHLHQWRYLDIDISSPLKIFRHKLSSVKANILRIANTYEYWYIREQIWSKISSWHPSIDNTFRHLNNIWSKEQWRDIPKQMSNAFTLSLRLQNWRNVPHLYSWRASRAVITRSCHEIKVHTYL